MFARTTMTLALVAGAMCVTPAAAGAAIDVKRDASTGSISIASVVGAPEAVVVERDEVGAIRVLDRTAAVTSSDASCSPDPVIPGAVTCSAAIDGVSVTAALGAGDDSLDVTAATGTSVVADGGEGSDRFAFADSVRITVLDATGTDTIDLSAASTAPTRVRFEPAVGRLVVRCTACATPFVATLPAFPGTVVLGGARDDVDLTTWRVPGRTTWALGEGDDRFFGSSLHRSTVAGGEGQDAFVSRAAVDTFRGEGGHDRFADFGGRGDVLDGGPGIDTFASLDGQRDSILGGASLDSCGRPNSSPRCDPGVVSGVEARTYLPITTVRFVLGFVGIR